MFVKDSRVEAFLTREGVKWKYTNAVKFSDLSANWQAVNAGRSTPLVDEAIYEYAEKTKQGSEGPAPILHQRPDGKDVLDGLQRLGAALLLGVSEFSAYVIETDSDTAAKKIRVFANQVLQGGHSETSAWTRARVVAELVVEGTMSAREIARMGGWNLADVEKEIRFQTWDSPFAGLAGQRTWPSALS